MLLSRPTTYAVRALLYLAKQDSAVPILAPTIAKEEHLPAPFLAKLLRTLAEAKILTSNRGPGGGYKLAKSPEQISLQDVSVLFDGLTLANECLLGYGRCSDTTPCPVHKLWGPRKTYMQEFLRETTIASLLSLESSRVGPVIDDTKRGRRKTTKYK
ncbi:Rrf2 family transcriptional regulator [bacterium]|nr:Rrf2 family transcriptional regulator [bacterium]